MAALPAPKGLGRLFVPDDPTATRRDDARDAQVRQLSQRVGPSAGPIRINGVKFTSPGPGAPGGLSNTVDVAHLLGREAQGYRVVRASQPVAVALQTSPTPGTHIRLACNNASGIAAGDELANVDIEVW